MTDFLAAAKAFALVVIAQRLDDIILLAQGALFYQLGDKHAGGE